MHEQQVLIFFQTFLSISERYFFKKKKPREKNAVFIDLQTSTIIFSLWQMIQWSFPTWDTDFTEEVDSCSGKSVSKGGLYPPRVGLAASSEARAVIKTQGG